MLKLVLIFIRLKVGDVVKLNRNPDNQNFLLSFMFIFRLRAMSIRCLTGLKEAQAAQIMCEFNRIIVKRRILLNSCLFASKQAAHIFRELNRKSINWHFLLKSHPPTPKQTAHLVGK